MLLDKITQYRPLTLLILITLISVLWTMMLNHGEFSAHETGVFILYIAGILIVQIGVISLCLLLRNLSIIAAAIFATFNLFTLIIVHNSRFAALEGLTFTALIATLTLGVGAVFWIRNKSFVKFTHIFSVIMMLIIGVQFVGEGAESLKGLLDRMPKFFRMVDFEKTPNIYVISFDAMVPEAIAKDIIGVDNVPYVDALKRQDLRFIPNSFAEFIPTKRSLNLTLAMDKEHYNNVSEDAGFLRDEVPNPAYEILRHNGYKIQFLYKTSYFGDDRDKLDYYGVAEIQGLCQHVEKDFSFMGYCLKRVQDKTKSWSKVQNIPYNEMLFDRIKTVSRSGEPWFTYAYIYEPGHAKLSFDYRKEQDKKEYRDEFARNSSRVVEVLETLLKTIKTHDPESVTVIFGDHGAMLSPNVFGDTRGIAADALKYSAEDLPKDYPLSFEQVVQDRHGVLNAIMPAGFCPSGFQHNPYSTMRIMRDLFICLSGGDDPMPTDIQPNDNRWSPYTFE